MFDLVHHKILHSFHAEHARLTTFILFYYAHTLCLLQYISLAWEPCVTQGTHSYSLRLPTHRRFLPGN